MAKKDEPGKENDDDEEEEEEEEVEEEVKNTNKDINYPWKVNMARIGMGNGYMLQEDDAKDTIGLGL